MANVQEIPTYFYINQYCQVKILFVDNINGANVNVTNPAFNIYKDGTNIPLTYIRKIGSTGVKTGEYSVSFITDTLEEGTYTAIATGYYPDATSNQNKITYTSTFDIFDVDNIQQYIRMLRIQLADDFPSAYLIDDPEKYRWTDEQLYSCIYRAVQYWNETPPVSTGVNLYTVETFPHIDTMLLIAEYYALNMKGILEIFNTIQYNDDTSFTIDRYPKLQSKMSEVLNLFKERVGKMKSDEIFRKTMPLGIKSTRLPIRALRSLSFSSPYLQFLGNSGGY